MVMRGCGGGYRRAYPVGVRAMDEISRYNKAHENNNGPGTLSNTSLNQTNVKLYN